MTLPPPPRSRSDRAPLEGVRVLDFTRVVAGPYCTMMLADLGAEVAKVEQPKVGDELRSIVRYRGRGPEDEDYFYALNRSKNSATLDLKNPAGREAAQSLARHADVVVENFVPGAAARLGVGWEDLHPLNPRLVYCSLSGFGQTGPYRDRLALDPIIQALSGVMSVTGSPEGEPTAIGAPIADVVAGMFAAYAVVACLYAVRQGEPGRFIDVSMLDSMIAVLGPRMGETLQAGVLPERVGNENPMRVPAGTYLASDGRYVDVIVQNDRYWEPFCRALDRPEWFQDHRFTTVALRIRHRAELNALVAARFAERAAAEWVERLSAERVPASVVNDYAGALADPQVLHRGLVRTVEHPRSGPIRVVGPPWVMDRAEAKMEPPPLLGQHTEQVLREWLGWGNAEIERLRSGTNA